MQDVFLVKEQGNYNLRNWTNFVFSQVENTNYGSESLCVLGPKIWEISLNELKNKESDDSL